MPSAVIDPQSVQAVLFDAVGTILAPEPDVATAYFQHGQALGAELSPQEVHRRFHQVFSRVFGSAPLEPCNEQTERDLWHRVVVEVFADQDVDHRRLFARLWEHFAQPRHWRLLPGVEELWPQLARAGYRLAVASNFDRRLESICRALPPLELAREVFTCSVLGVRKPAVRFFREIARRLQLPPEACLMVGDTLPADVLPARQAGFQAVWLCPQPAPCSSQQAASGSQGQVPVIRQLTELAELLGLE